MDHLLGCTEKLFAADYSGICGESCPRSNQDNIKISNRHRKKHQEPLRDALHSGNDGKSLLRGHYLIGSKLHSD